MSCVQRRCRWVNLNCNAASMHYKRPRGLCVQKRHTRRGRHEISAIQSTIREPLDALGNALRRLLDAVAQVTDVSIEIEKLHEQLLAAIEKHAHLSSEDAWDGLRWLEVNARSIRLNLTPLDVSETLQGMFSAGLQSWIFTSATLAVGEDFGHFTNRMGIAGAKCLTFPSPYAIQERGLIWLPSDLPAPSDQHHTERMLASVLPLLDATRGGMFCLFTSHRALNAAKKWVARPQAAA